MTQSPTDIAAEMERLAGEALPITPVAYRPERFDDWGVVRGCDGSHVLQVRWSEHTEADLNRHRAAKTDPWGAEAKLYVAYRNNHAEIIAALGAAGEVGELRKALGDAVDWADRHGKEPDWLEDARRALGSAKE